VNLAELILHHARYNGSNAAVVTRDSVTTYAEFEIMVRRIAGALRDRVVGAGDLVAVRMRDTPAHLATLAAVMHIGGIVLPFDWRAAVSEIDRIAARFPPKIVVVDGRSPLPAGLDTLDAATALEAAPDSNPPVVLTDHPLVYSLTSGTTGEPKAIVLTHEQMFGRTVTLLLEHVVQPDDRFLALLPLAYSNGRVINFSLLTLGATVMLFPAIFEPGELIRFVEEQQLNGLMVSPNIARQLIGLERRPERLMPRLRVFVTGGSKFQPEERAALRDRVAANVIDYYGSTGGGPTAIIARPDEGAAPTSMGRPMFSLKVEIVDDDGRSLPAGTVGRLRVRGPGVASGFAETTDMAEDGFRDGWHYPGDLGSLDTDGMLHLHGRTSELIKRGGAMVYAQEVEQALLRHPGVTDAAVVGAPSPELGQEVVAFVTLASPADERALIQHCRTQLAPFKVPARVEIIDALPRNPSGKVVKGDLLKRLHKR
jgi:acyl-coenzyme A synthetase/AMP-(fatty) acid ligase